MRLLFRMSCSKFCGVKFCMPLWVVSLLMRIFLVQSVFNNHSNHVLEMFDRSILCGRGDITQIESQSLFPFQLLLCPKSKMELHIKRFMYSTVLLTYESDIVGRLCFLSPIQPFENSRFCLINCLFSVTT